MSRGERTVRGCRRLRRRPDRRRRGPDAPGRGDRRAARRGRPRAGPGRPQLLPKARVLHATGIEPDFLERERVAHAQAAILAMRDDAKNLYVATLAKLYRMGMTIAIVHDTVSERVFERGRRRRGDQPAVADGGGDRALRPRPAHPAGDDARGRPLRDPRHHRPRGELLRRPALQGDADDRRPDRSDRPRRQGDLSPRRRRTRSRRPVPSSSPSRSGSARSSGPFDRGLPRAARAAAPDGGRRRGRTQPLRHDPPVHRASRRCSRPRSPSATAEPVWPFLLAGLIAAAGGWSLERVSGRQGADRHPRGLPGRRPDLAAGGRLRGAALRVRRGGCAGPAARTPTSRRCQASRPPARPWSQTSQALDRSLLMWRQFTQWLGGMGIIVLALAVLPRLRVGGRQLLEQEMPGPEVEPLTASIRKTAQRLWLLYVGAHGAPRSDPRRLRPGPVSTAR